MCSTFRVSLILIETCESAKNTLPQLSRVGIQPKFALVGIQETDQH